MKYDIYETKDDTLIKSDCTLQALIPANHALSDDEVRNYFGIDEGHRHWDRAHRPYLKVNRLVFDKIIIPDSYAYRIVPVSEEDD